MRKRGWIVALVLLSLTLSGCHTLVEDAPEQLSVYATFYPIYALTEPLTEDVPDLTLNCLVQPQDGCLRNYALSDWDIYLLASADAVIAGGRGLESFESTLFGLGDSGPAVSAVLYNLELLNSTRSSHDAETESHLDGPNPHLYMSVDGAKQIVESIGAMLQTFDPRYAQTYADNAARVIETLDGLRRQTLEITGDLTGEKVILMNETLGYVAEDYGLEVAGQYDRESGVALYDNELKECLEQLEKYEDAKVVLIEAQAPTSLVMALEQNGYSVALIDILSTHRASEGFDGYIQAQQNNARAIHRAFDGEDNS